MVVVHVASKISKEYGSQLKSLEEATRMEREIQAAQEVVVHTTNDVKDGDKANPVGFGIMVCLIFIATCVSEYLLKTY
jgi:hypothetical protein